MRTKGQQYWDRFVLLHLSDAVTRHRSAVGGNLKAQKLAFLVELGALRNGLKSAHYRFFRYNLGPYSAELARDIALLETASVVSKSTRQLTKKGNFLHEYILGVLRQNMLPEVDQTLQLIEAIGHEHGRKTGNRLKDEVYRLRVPVYELGQEETVRDVPMHMDILDPVHTEGLTEVQPLPDDVIADIDAELAINAARLNPDHESFKRTVRTVLARIPA